ncbi:ATP-dependent Clp protease proteolytic subunit [uncultured Clostridium sp.]|uniref:ATP-dependent Clp protease proteolytic subunit n=1 Tax=uncultured Clostridium sp. TaxID=59620 RepID=UPI003216BADD
MGNTQYINPITSEMKIKSANNKKIYLNGEVNEDMAMEVSYYVNKIIELDKTNPNPSMEVTFIVNSFGGSVIHGNAIIGNINKLKSLGYKTIAIIESCAYSMAFDIIIHCDVRVGYNLSTYLLHQTAFGMGSELKEFEREVEFQKRLWSMAVDYYVENTKIPRERIEQIYDRKENYFFTASDALENGTIQEIL